MLHRWSNDRKELASPTQYISLTPKEMLCLLMHITIPYKTEGTTNCLIREWAGLFNDIMNNCLKSKMQQSHTKNSESPIIGRR